MIELESSAIRPPSAVSVARMSKSSNVLLKTADRSNLSVPVVKSVIVSALLRFSAVTMKVSVPSAPVRVSLSVLP